MWVMVWMSELNEWQQATSGWLELHLEMRAELDTHSVKRVDKLVHGKNQRSSLRFLCGPVKDSEVE